MLINTGVQKRLALYLMLRIGVRGGIELWQLQRCDIQIETDNVGREYVQFEERESKQNQWGVDRSQEHLFRNIYYSYKPDFVFTVIEKYYRHLPVLEDGVVLDLFTSAITNPIGNVWFNKKSKVSKDRSSQWLSNMLTLVGLPKDLFMNKSGWTALITRMAIQGVPDHVGMMITGYHTQGGYSRYDRTLHLKQEAVVLVASCPGVTYESALAEVTENFRLEKVVGNLGNLKPLIAPPSMMQVESSSSVESCLTETKNEVGRRLPPPGQLMLHSAKQVALSTELPTESKDVQPEAEMDVLKLNADPKTMARWHAAYDNIDWEAAAKSDPMLALALAGRKSTQLTFGQNIMGGSFSNCTFHIHSPAIPGPSFDLGMKENIEPP